MKLHIRKLRLKLRQSRLNFRLRLGEVTYATFAEPSAKVVEVRLWPCRKTGQLQLVFELELRFFALVDGQNFNSDILESKLDVANGSG